MEIWAGMVVAAFVAGFYFGRSGRTEEITYLRAANTDLQKKFLAKNLGEYAAFGEGTQENAPGMKVPRTDEVEWLIEQEMERG